VTCTEYIDVYYFRVSLPSVSYGIKIWAEHFCIRFVTIHAFDRQANSLLMADSLHSRQRDKNLGNSVIGEPAPERRN